MQKNMIIYDNEVLNNKINTELLGILEDVDKTKADIYKHMQTLISLGAVEKTLFYDVEDWGVSINDNIITLDIPDTPIVIHQHTPTATQNYNRQRWIGNISHAVSSLNAPRYLDKVFIYIKYSFPIKCDIDNSFFKPIIDGIRYSGIIKDDTFDSVSIMHNGEICRGNPRTIIHIIPVKNLQIKGLDL